MYISVALLRRVLFFLPQLQILEQTLAFSSRGALSALCRLNSYKMPKKPIKQGYKIYGIVDHGYLYNFLQSSREKGLQNILYQPGLTKTACLVQNLTLSLLRRRLAIYIDNYFTSVSLFKELQPCEFGTTGTTCQGISLGWLPEIPRRRIGGATARAQGSRSKPPISNHPSQSTCTKQLQVAYLQNPPGQRIRRGLQGVGRLFASLYVYRSDLRVYLLGALQFVLHGIQEYTTCSTLTVILQAYIRSSLPGLRYLRNGLLQSLIGIPFLQRQLTIRFAQLDKIINNNIVLALSNIHTVHTIENFREKVRRRPTKKKNLFYEWDKDKDKIQDEYERYITEPLVLGVKIGYKQWLEETQQKRYPNLSKMALDLLSIPAMSSDPERLFSRAKITVTDRRNKLRIEVIQALKCIKSWLKIIESQDDDIEDQDQDILDSLSTKQARS